MLGVLVEQTNINEGPFAALRPHLRTEPAGTSPAGKPSFMAGCDWCMRYETLQLQWESTVLICRNSGHLEIKRHHLSNPVRIYTAVSLVWF